MGRAMLIIVAGVLISLGITQTSVFGGLNNLVGHSTNYAETAQAQNIAYMGTELAIQKMISEEWTDGEEPFTIGGGEAVVSVEETGTNDQFRLVSTGRFNGEVQQISMLLEKDENSLVPTIKSALGLYFDSKNDLNKIGVSGGGSNKGQIIDGTDKSPSNCEAVPAITAAGDDVFEHDSFKEGGKKGGGGGENIDPIVEHLKGSEKYESDPDMDFSDIQALIDALDTGQDSDRLKYLQNDISQEDFGQIKDNGLPDPKVFIVNNTTARMTGNIKGSGILIVRSTGNIEAALDIAGTPEFHGLVIFENAYSMSASGTVSLYGSVLVGKSEGSGYPPFDIQFNGNAKLQYDCRAQDYANLAASHTAHRVFQQQSVYQTSINPDGADNYSDDDGSLLNKLLNRSN